MHKRSMRVGLDFDNTIVSYDSLFHKVAVEGGHVPASTAPSKLAVRDYLRAQGREEIWTEMQGYVYGARMMEAAAFPGVLDFLRQARGAGLGVSIVSHKTRHPFLGPRYDLHAAAREWIDNHLMDASGLLIPSDMIHFELTKEDKLKRICTSDFVYFIDDLPEILSAPAFPAATVPVLFDPAGSEALPRRAVRAADWRAVWSIVGASCLSS